MIKKKMPYRYTKTELKKLLDNITVLIDTRENKTDHIKKYFDSKDIDYKSKKLDFGDYSFCLSELPELDINRPIYFNDSITIERKANLEELSNCFAQDRQRFENELIRSQGGGAKLILLIEDGKGYEKIVNGRYNTQYNKKSFIGTLQAFRARYGIDINFINPKYSGNFIITLFHYYLREYLK